MFASIFHFDGKMFIYTTNLKCRELITERLNVERENIVERAAIEQEGASLIPQLFATYLYLSQSIYQR